jgi:hypothetical protein
MQNALTSPLFNRPQHRRGWTIAAVAAAIATAADNVAARVVHVSDINAADFGAVGGAMSKAMAGARGEGEAAQVG